MIGRLLLSMVSVAGIAAAPGTPDHSIERMMAGGPMLDPPALAAAIATAEASPLGSAANPVRVEMPRGEIAYLRTLRCADDSAPKFGRRGSMGEGPFGSIVDLYDVDCGAAAPGRVEIRMDMYHPGHVETRAVPGFTTANTI